MKKFVLMITFFLVAFFAYPQADNSKHTLVVGIGNKDNAVFKNTITFIKSQSELKILKICETQKALQIEKDNDFYKDDMEFLKYLQTNIEGLIINKKEGSIMENECFYEILKQKN
jgi:hypothetical protein